ncbi:MAG: co-chaperone GroES [Candidatus Saccharicenans sp.]|jgi:chaperonin GroES|uniref:Co-chaperonin GroES n=1 Tax=Candidatus Saccharicenans subterraneus TaxID=2508984 RepID=A0A3E2BPL2_9BACT|nr:co-chaperone GroES [Candidatus Saccharicenans sp.]MCX8160532.1 co-chaperone GroES [Candidatus Saccharicenans sp.]MDH7576026.1 co-chaperone GroES [Candidatus Saccharicenans sp.]RFT16675.1 MAG: Heat shock protein 60 family co-chaperone GroES [Candidatus Saccharicenans subterraneum]
MKIQPLYDRVLLKRIEEQEVKRGNIIIPDTAKEKPQEAEVIEVGKGRVTEDGKVVPLTVKKGDRVLIGKYSGTEVTIDGVEHVIVREEEILAVITK